MNWHLFRATDGKTKIWYITDLHHTMKGHPNETKAHLLARFAQSQGTLIEHPGIHTLAQVAQTITNLKFKTPP